MTRETNLSGPVARVWLAGLVMVAAILTGCSAGKQPAPAPTASQPALVRAADDASAIEPAVDRAAPVLDTPGAGMPDKTPPNDISDSNGLSLAPATEGQASPTTGPSIAATAPAATTPAVTGAKANKNEFLLVPIPSYKPTFGFGLQGMGAYLFSVDPEDKVSPSSSIALMGYGAQNGTWLGGAATRLFLKEDQFRLIAGLFTGQINYDFSGVGTGAGESGDSVPLKENLTTVIVEPLVSIAPRLYLGPRFVYAKIHTSADFSELDDTATPPADERDSIQSMIGAHLQYDTRDSVFYPRKGMLIDLHTEFHDPAWGDDFNYQVYKLFYNQYFSLAPRQVLAVRGAAQASVGDVPFYSLPTIGKGPDLRGYKYGQFQDKTLLAVQAEYRVELTKRFGVVGFAGVGEVAPALGDYALDDLLPSVGAGLRYVVAEKNHVALRLDFAWGREGGTYYFTVGEAF